MGDFFISSCLPEPVNHPFFLHSWGNTSSFSYHSLLGIASNLVASSFNIKGRSTGVAFLSRVEVWKQFRRSTLETEAWLVSDALFWKALTWDSEKLLSPAKMEMLCVKHVEERKQQFSFQNCVSTFVTFVVLRITSNHKAKVCTWPGSDCAPGLMLADLCVCKGSRCLHRFIYRLRISLLWSL